MINFTPESDWYTPGNSVSQFIMLSGSLTSTGLTSTLFDTLKHGLCRSGQRLSATKSVRLKNKIWLDEITTVFFNILRQEAGVLVWAGRWVRSRNHTYMSGSLNKALLHMCSLFVSFLTAVRRSERACLKCLCHWPCFNVFQCYLSKWGCRSDMRLVEQGKWVTTSFTSWSLLWKSRTLE